MSSLRILYIIYCILLYIDCWPNTRYFNVPPLTYNSLISVLLVVGLAKNKNQKDSQQAVAAAPASMQQVLQKGKKQKGERGEEGERGWKRERKGDRNQQGTQKTAKQQQQQQQSAKQVKTHWKPAEGNTFFPSVRRSTKFSNLFFARKQQIAQSCCCCCCSIYLLLVFLFTRPLWLICGTINATLV